MKIFLDSIGCRLNQSEIESMARQFRQAGHKLVANPESCDLAVINSCSVISAAASDSRAKARRAHRANPLAGIVLTGCWSSIKPQDAAGLPGVMRVIPNASKVRLVPDLLGLVPEDLEGERRLTRAVPGQRMRTRAFIKAQDGCDNHCTFCLTTIARGRARSMPQARVIEEVRQAAAGGALEVVLTGVQLSAYGSDLGDGYHLAGLVRAILSETDVARVRLSSLEPWALNERFFELWQNSRLCRHLHLPLQSGCAATLRRMGRPITPAAYARLASLARSVIPDLALTTDLIAGFPGESAEEFEHSLRFVSDLALSGAHVFTYSARPGTAAAQLPDHVPGKVARKRSAQLRNVVEEGRAAFVQRFAGKRLKVLWESAARVGPEEWELSGFSDNYLRVKARASRNLSNRISQVLATRVEEGILRSSLA